MRVVAICLVTSCLLTSAAPSRRSAVLHSYTLGRKYVGKFYFWLDVVATFTLLLDIKEVNAALAPRAPMLGIPRNLSSHACLLPSDSRADPPAPCRRQGSESHHRGRQPGEACGTARLLLRWVSRLRTCMTLRHSLRFTSCWHITAWNPPPSLPPQGTSGDILKSAGKVTKIGSKVNVTVRLIRCVRARTGRLASGRARRDLTASLLGKWTTDD